MHALEPVLARLESVVAPLEPERKSVILARESVGSLPHPLLRGLLLGGVYKVALSLPFGFEAPEFIRHEVELVIRYLPSADTEEKSVKIPIMLEAGTRVWMTRRDYPKISRVPSWRRVGCSRRWRRRSAGTPLAEVPRSRVGLWRVE